MTRILGLLIVAAGATHAFAEQGNPSAETLADMGLAGLQIVPDSDVLNVRGNGFDPRHLLQGFDDFEHGKAAFRSDATEFHGRLRNHTYGGAAKSDAWRAEFHSHVARFREATSQFPH